MSNSTTPSDCSSNNSTNISKLRRLKIQQNVLSANLQKSLCSLQECCDDTIIDADSKLMLKKYVSKLKDLYNEIKYLYEDIKARTSFEGNFDKFEIDEIKSDTLKLESKIKYFKEYLRTELTSAQEEEELLISKLNETTKIEAKNISHKKTHITNTYNEIVPSPVRAIINSPFKCLEVHQYQEFLRNSVNRYGGWNEYNHNMFVQIWDKYYKDIDMTSNENLPHFEEFKHEILQKIPEINIEDVIVHSNWYCQYVFLRMQQQNALNKWQENKRKIKKQQPKPTNTKNAIGFLSVSQRICSKAQSNTKEFRSTANKGRTEFSTLENLSKTDHIKTRTSCLLKPTRQWINRCQNKEIFETNLNIENVSKLRIPNWRLPLQ